MADSLVKVTAFSVLALGGPVLGAWRLAAERARISSEEAEQPRQEEQPEPEEPGQEEQPRQEEQPEPEEPGHEEQDEQNRGQSTGAHVDYDAIFTLKSLSEFIASKHISMLRSPKSLLDIAVESQYRIVAVVGLYDKGKTFLVNKLFGTDLPSGKLHSTKGLSFYWVEHRRMLVLDSAGVQGTISYRAAAVEPVLDAQTTESLIFEIISRIAHHLIFVVNDLTWFEQKYIAMLHQKYVQSHQSKELIVVHNMRTTSCIEEARELFSRQITQCYEGQTSHLAELTYTSELGGQGPAVQHIGMCDEATDAGKKFNKCNRNMIMNMLELKNMLGSRVMLSRLLKDELTRLLPKFLNVELPESTPATPEILVDYEPAEAARDVANEVGTADLSRDYVEAGKFVLRSSPANGRISMKTRGVISDLGEIIAHDVTFQPLKNVYDKIEDNGVKRHIEIECPGVSRAGIRFMDIANGVKVIIEKQKAIDEVVVQPVIPIRQHHGRWEQDFVYDSSEGKFVFEGGDLKDGVLSVVLRKETQTREWGLDGSGFPTSGSNETGNAPGHASGAMSPRSATSASGDSYASRAATM